MKKVSSPIYNMAFLALLSVVLYFAGQFYKSSINKASYNQHLPNHIEADSALFRAITQHFDQDNPSTKKNKLDCSGFVKEVFENAYKVKLEGSSEDIYNIAQPVTYEQLKPGDLVFFRIKNKKINHVGIYMGDFVFAHVSSKNGIELNSLQDPYYSRYYVAGGRISPQENHLQKPG
jgi:cell wall-associated NlpC family hydrolase